MQHYQIDGCEDWFDLLKWFMEVSNGHHGLPVKQERKSSNDFYNFNDKQAVIEFTQACLDIFSIKAFFENTNIYRIPQILDFL
jgi:hypothetical protein